LQQKHQRSTLNTVRQWKIMLFCSNVSIGARRVHILRSRYMERTRQ